jgi:FkbM family methyltransferase
MVTRRLAAFPQSTSEKVAIYLSRRAPKDINSVSARYLGVTFQLDLRDNLQRDLFYLGRYEKDLLDFLLSEVRVGDVFVDIGAHIGTFALPVARRLAESGRVIAFEPAADTAAVLELNARENGIDCLTVVRSALGSVTATGHLRESSSSNYLPQDLGVRSLHGTGRVVAEVPVIPFDEWVAECTPERIDIVKIDVEGSEFEVLEGMRGSLRKYRPRLLIVEVVERHLERSGASATLLEDILSGQGYRAHGPRITEIASSRTGPFWPNAVLRRCDQPGVCG